MFQLIQFTAKWRLFCALLACQVSVAYAYPAAPAHIEAENYISMSGVQSEGTGDVGGGSDVGWIDTNDYMDYGIHIPVAGNYTVKLRVASIYNSASIRFYSNGTAVGSKVAVPLTGAWQTYTTITTTLSLPAGDQVLRIYADVGGYNLNWFEIAPAAGSYRSIPARIEAESFDAYNNVKTEWCGDAGNGQDVGYIYPGSYMDYHVNAPSAGTYRVNLRVASLPGGGIIKLLSNGNDISGNINVPGTGNWQVYTTISVDVNLPAGQQTIRTYSVNGNWNLNWLEFVSAAASPPPATPVPVGTPAATPAATIAPPSGTGPLPTPIPGVAAGLPPTSSIPGTINLWHRNAPNQGNAYNSYDAVVYLPADYNANPTKKYPLILSLYGIGGYVLSPDHNLISENPEGFIKQVWNGQSLQSTYGAIVIAPEGRSPNDSGNVWWTADYNAQLIIDAMKYYRVDAKRIVATGLSAGGDGVSDLLNKYKSLFAGASIVARFPPNNNYFTPANTCPLAGFPIWAAGNYGDGNFGWWSWAHNFQPVLANCPGYDASKLQITVVSQSAAHGGWDEFYGTSATQQWMQSQVQK